MIRVALLLSSSMLLAAPALAEWKPNDSSNDFEGYFDPSSIHATGQVVRMRSLNNFTVAQSVEGRVFWSETSLAEYDCAGERRRTLEIVQFADKMASGLVVNAASASGQWVSVRHGSVGEARWKRACAVLSAAPAPAARGDQVATAAHPIVGTWLWPVGPNCAERHEFSRNGRAVIVANQRRVAWDYVVSAKPDRDGVYALTMTVDSANAGADCRGKAQANLFTPGDVLDAFLTFRSNQMFICPTREAASKLQSCDAFVRATELSQSQSPATRNASAPGDASPPSASGSGERRVTFTNKGSVTVGELKIRAGDGPWTKVGGILLPGNRYDFGVPQGECRYEVEAGYIDFKRERGTFDFCRSAEIALTHERKTESSSSGERVPPRVSAPPRPAAATARAYDVGMLKGLSEPEVRQFFANVLRDHQKVACDVDRTFLSYEATTGAQTWSVGCRGGDAYGVIVYPDAGQPPVTLACSFIAAQSSVKPCFVKW